MQLNRGRPYECLQARHRFISTNTSAVFDTAPSTPSWQTSRAPEAPRPPGRRRAPLSGPQEEETELVTNLMTATFSHRRSQGSSFVYSVRKFGDRFLALRGKAGAASGGSRRESRASWATAALSAREAASAGGWRPQKQADAP